MATTFADFNRETREIEGRLAYGSETPLRGDFCRRMAEIGGTDWIESEAEVPADEAAWWRKAYGLYEADLAKPVDEQATDLQDIYNAV